MICSKCKEEGEKSTVQIGPRYVTAMANQPFYDEEGRYHSHDGNVATTHYSCSRGHTWSEGSQRSCPSCTWPDKPALLRSSKGLMEA